MVGSILIAINHAYLSLLQYKLRILVSNITAVYIITRNYHANLAI